MSYSNNLITNNLFLYCYTKVYIKKREREKFKVKVSLDQVPTKSGRVLFLLIF